MKDHEVIIGTRHDATCAPKLAAVVGAIFTRHDFNVHENVAGYTGGNIVATFRQPRTQRVQRAEGRDQRRAPDDHQPRRCPR
jgi:N-formylglutamate amidohydrolase